MPRFIVEIPASSFTDMLRENDSAIADAILEESRDHISERESSTSDHIDGSSTVEAPSAT